MTTFIPTQEQIAAAQEAGNIAHQQAESFGQGDKGQYFAYRAAYQDVMSRYEVEAQRQQAAPVTVTLDDIAEMCLRCDETSSADEYSSATEGHW